MTDVLNTSVAEVHDTAFADSGRRIVSVKAAVFDLDMNNKQDVPHK